MHGFPPDQIRDRMCEGATGAVMTPAMAVTTCGRIAPHYDIPVRFVFDYHYFVPAAFVMMVATGMG